MEPIVVKCPDCNWMRLAEYPGPDSKEAMFVWADGLHQKERPACAYRFQKIAIRPMHEVKFSDALWDKLDRLSAQNPESSSDDEV
jgi:hypothetical protein